MKVKYTTANGRLTFEFESDTDKKLVANLAHIQEVFEEPACGCCKSERIRFDVREFDKNFYYKLLCDKCGATLDFGQHKTGDSLFVKRFEKDSREPLPNKGWYVYAEKAMAVPSANQKTQAPPSAPAKPELTPPSAASAAAEKVKKAVDAMDNASTLQNFAEWVKWAKDNVPGADVTQRETLEQARQRNKARLERETAGLPPRRQMARA